MELTKNFEHRPAEKKWYDHWLEKKYFNSKPDDPASPALLAEAGAGAAGRREPYTIVIPPPNVTGILHMGHCLNNTIQDILIRRARMQGKNACWVPGTDHASIATEAKVVQMLRERGINKSNISREEFLKYAWEWKDQYGGIILQQLKKLGCSLDWDRTTFTMDPDYYTSVIDVFIDLYKKGYIYRGKRMINWDPSAKTALSDEEVIRKEVQSKLYYIKYELDVQSQESGVGSGESGVRSRELGVGSRESGVGSQESGVGSRESGVGSQESGVGSRESGVGSRESGVGSREETHNSQLITPNYITIATVRPETILGDTAIAVNPNDERYKHLHGKFAFVPLINRRIPIIADEYVEMDFGTGALKITPAHDKNDYQIGEKHGLEVIDTMNDDGTMSEAARLYIGEDRFEVRKKIVKELEAKGHLVKIEDYANQIGFSERTDVVVEDRLSLQWWVDMKKLYKPALDAVMDGEIIFYPAKFKNLYRNWMENIRDWCISRQLWWGHRIPAWYDEEGRFVVARDEEEAGKLFSQKNPESRIQNPELKQDGDVLDTWFSSWLWPIEVFKGYSNPGNADIKYYYPTNTLVTAPEIIFFWVARMIMAGFEYMHEKPFSEVYFTGIVRDELGRKMSKQLGNSPDLLGLIDKYGADAVRFGIMISSPAGNDLLFDVKEESTLKQGSFFINKIWNALRLVRSWELRVGRRESGVASRESGVGSWESGVGSREPGVGSRESGVGSRESGVRSENFSVVWFENRLNQVRAEIEGLYKDFRLSEILKTIYSLIWDDFCSWYLEWVKPAYAKASAGEPGFEQPIDKEVYDKTVEFFEELMQLLHPFMPFVTEDIYHLLKERTDDITVKQFASIGSINSNILEKGFILKNDITAIRDARKKNGIKNIETLKFMGTGETHIFYLRNQNLLSLLQKQTNLIYSVPNNIVKNSLNEIIVNSDNRTFFLSVERNIDISVQKEQLIKELEYHKGFLSSVEKKLSNERFVQNAKPEVVEAERKKKADAEAKIKAIKESLQSL